jgi:hypothetical protein
MNLKNFNIKENRWILMVLTFLIVMTISAFGRQIRSFFDNKEKEDEFELIRKYLQPDNHDFNPKPRIWIYNDQIKNDPYLVFTIKSIVSHCGEDFNVCIVDDKSFSQLIPTWNDDKNRTNIAERDREYGMMLLLYLYGGIIVPKSFLCLQSLKSLYQTYDTLKIPFVVENINRFDNSKAGNMNNLRFLPDPSFMGAPKDSETVKDILHFITSHKRDMCSIEYKLTGSLPYWCLSQIQKQKITLIDGEFIGIKGSDKRAITVEDFMEDKPLSINENKCLGIYIPSEELRKRLKYRWFTEIGENDVLQSPVILSTYFQLSLYPVSDPM